MSPRNPGSFSGEGTVVILEHTQGTANIVTEHHIPRDLKPLKCCCGNLKSHSVELVVI
jgi:hypothetical protein